MYTLVRVRPVFDVNATLLHIERIVRHIECTGSVEISAEHPQYPSVAADVHAKVTCVRDIVKLVSAKNKCTRVKKQ